MKCEVKKVQELDPKKQEMKKVHEALAMERKAEEEDWDCDLSKCMLKEGVIKELATLLKLGRAPLTLNLSRNPLKNTIGTLIDGLNSDKAQSHLTLDLSHTQIGQANAKKLAAVLKSGKAPPNLELRLTKACFGVEAAKKLTEAKQPQQKIEFE